MDDDHDTLRPRFRVTVPVLGFLVGLLLAAAAEGQTLQEIIDGTSPGDTVLIEPGDYVRAVTVDKAVTLMPRTPGTVRLAGLSGSAATVAGILFDGELTGKSTTLAVCGPGLRFEDCVFQGPTSQGARLEPGAADVAFRGCTFDNLVQAIGLETGAVSLVLEDTEITGCPLALNGPDDPLCDGGGPREPAARCESGCGSVTLTRVLISGGGRQITMNGDYTVTITESTLEGASEWAMTAGGIRLEMAGTDCFSEGGKGTGLTLHSVSGFLHNSRISGWNVAMVVDDGGCSRYSDLTLGGSLDIANDISGQAVGLDLEQPEPLEAELNFWGSFDCSVALSHILGQTVTSITDAHHVLAMACSGTPVHPVTWGRIKARFGTEGGDPRP